MEDYIFITGASGGFGIELCRELSKNNRLILSGSNHDKLYDLRLNLSNPDSHKICVLDLANNKSQINSLLSEFIMNENLSVSSFVHCAGVTKILPLKNFSIDNVELLFNVNLFSAIEILRVLLKKTNNGRLTKVLFISALWSIRGNKGNSIYAASKGAINSLVYSLTQELAPKVRVNAILPGLIITPMSKNLNKEFVDELTNDTPLGAGTSEDIVNYACFLLSEKAKWITGQNIIIDGGRSTK